ncbi:MAG: hypothetical protein ACOYL3_12000 [Desulfuromonadaceae bacterium]
MKNRIKWSLVTCMLVAVGLMNGCGGGNDTYNTVKTTTAPVAVTPNVADGSATTTSVATVKAPADAPAAVANVEVVVPAATIITAKDTTGKTVPLTAPTFTFQAPDNATATSAGTTSVPVPTGFNSLDSTSVAIDVQITGAASSEFSKPITIKLPAPGKANGSVVNKVYKNKNDGKGNILVGGPYTVVNGEISFEVSDLCWFIGDPVYKTITGTTGSGGSDVK